MCQKKRKAITMVEVAVIIAIVVILAGLLLPATQRSREGARRNSCASNIRHIGIGLTNYEYSYKMLPSLSSGFGLPNSRIDSSSVGPSPGRWSGFAGMLPMLRSGPFFAYVDAGFDGQDAAGNSVKYGPYGQYPGGWATPADPWYMPASTAATQEFNFFRCPSDPSGRKPSLKPSLARTNYAFNLGDSQVGSNLVTLDEKVVRGPFMRGLQLDLSYVSDGTSYTIAFGEIATSDRVAEAPRSEVRSIGDFKGVTYGGLNADPNMPLRGIDVRQCRNTLAQGRYKEIEHSKHFGTQGTRWLDALPCYNGFMTINPPNAASCSSSLEGEGIYSSGGYHFGGAHVVMLDCSVKFISEDIDTADESRAAKEYYTPGIAFDPKKKEWIKSQNWKAESPFGVWGAMGTVASGENLETAFPIDPGK